MPASRLSRIEIGKELFAKKHLTEAQQYFQAALDNSSSISDSELAKAHYFMAECQFADRNYGLAMYHYNMSIELNDQDFQAYFDRGYLHQKLSMLQMSIDDFNRSIILNPQYPSSFHNRGVAYKQLGDIDQAIENFRIAIRLTGSNSRTKKSLVDLLLPTAIRLFEQNKLEEAMDLLTECALLRTENHQVFAERGALFTRLQMFADAADDFTLALKIKPHAIDILKARANAFMQLGQLEQASADFRTILELRPSETATRGLHQCMRTLSGREIQQFNGIDNQQLFL